MPWLAVVLYVVSPGRTGASDPPGFVSAIIVSLFVLFNVFAVNQYLQYRQVGRWRDYLFGEYVYVGLSLVAKSLLAWQVLLRRWVTWLAWRREHRGPTGDRGTVR